WMIKFMAPWCPACQSFKEVWENYTTWSEDLNIRVAIVDVTENPGLSGRFLVTSLPTVFHVKGGVFRYYTGPRVIGELISFVEEQKWQEIEPVNGWITPDSVLMSCLSHFFKAAMYIRSLYSTMTEVYGIPEWGCYIIFALATLLLGFLAGMLIVCCVDILFPVSAHAAAVSQKHRPSPSPSPSPPPPSPQQQQQQSAAQQKDDSVKDDESDIVDDTASAPSGCTDTLRHRTLPQDN
ncbi:thioredoxin-related transmembrane protein 1-like, partial, partial [Argonauta hians]